MKDTGRGPWMWLGDLFPGLRGNDEMYPITLRPRDPEPVDGLAGERAWHAPVTHGVPTQISLDGRWRYCHTADDERFASAVTSDALWPTMELPNNWYLDGLEHAGVVWFRRPFGVPASARGKRLRLRFEGVDYFA